MSKFDGDDTIIAASGGNIGPFRHAVIYDDTHANDLLIVSIDLGADKTVLDGDQTNLIYDASNGIFTIG